MKNNKNVDKTITTKENNKNIDKSVVKQDIEKLEKATVNKKEEKAKVPKNEHSQLNNPDNKEIIEFLECKGNGVEKVEINDNAKNLEYVESEKIKSALDEPIKKPKKIKVKKRTKYSELEPKVAVIVGGSSGIGLELAKIMCAENYIVYNLSRTQCPFKSVVSMEVDVTDDGGLKFCFDTILHEHGSIDSVIYCAGSSMACPIECVAEPDLRYLWEVNYFGFIKTLWAVLPSMRKARDGRIIVVSSMAGAIPIPFDAPYSASKSALDMTIRELTIELAPYNICVTSVQPGGVCTDFTFKRKVYSGSVVGEYADALESATLSLASIEQGGSTPQKVANEIFMLLGWTNPPSIYTVGINNKALKLTQKFMPASFTEFINKRTFNLPKD